MSAPTTSRSTPPRNSPAHTFRPTTDQLRPRGRVRPWTYVAFRILGAAPRVLLTNDDGIDAEGLQTLRRALVALDDIELAVVAPDENQSATARSISIRRPPRVEESPFDDRTGGSPRRRPPAGWR